jgi:glucosamine-6-phosphate deaminase
MNIVVVSPDEFASRAADIVSRVVTENTAPNICFPTGNTPEGLYQELVKRYENGLLSLANVRAFGLDEWGDLENGHPVRCINIMQRCLYQKTDISPAYIYFLEPNRPDIEEQCKAYDELIERHGGLTLSILGLGLNGHVGFNEPGSKASDRTRVVRLDSKTQTVGQKYGMEKTPTWGVTVGLATLLESMEILILVNGEHKAEIVDRVVNGPVTSDVPATFLRDHPNCTLLLDTHAAKRL